MTHKNLILNAWFLAGFVFFFAIHAIILNERIQIFFFFEIQSVDTKQFAHWNRGTKRLNSKDEAFAV